MISDRKKFYWCFSHGTMHDSDWCTAFRVPITARSIEDAGKIKEYCWGPEKFMDDLPPNLQMIAMEFYRE